jgi:hypothetical protein
MGTGSGVLSKGPGSKGEPRSGKGVPATSKVGPRVEPKGEPEVEEEAAVEPEAAVEEPPQKPAKPEKKRGRMGALVGGTFLGLLLGVGGALALWLTAGYVVPPAWVEAVGLTPPGTKEPSKPGGTTTTQPAPVTLAAKMDHLKNGDLDKAAEAGVEQIDESKSEELYARGDYRWSKYLKDQAGKGPFKIDDAPVQQALADLKRAVDLKNPDAQFLIGQIHEITGNFKQAQDEYRKGADLFKNDPTQKLRFETALLSLNLRMPNPTGAVGALPAGMRLAAGEALLVMLVLFQPGARTPPPPAVPDEAGFSFWQAVKLSRGGKYDQAIKALDDARARHDKRRFAHLRKQQNPLSDPSEQIFLRACDELKTAWQIEQKLRNPDYLDLDPKQRLQAVDALLKKAQASLLKELGEKLAKDKAITKAEDLIAAVGAEKKASTESITKLEDSVKAEKEKVTDLTKKLENTTKLADDNATKLKDALAREKTLKAANDAQDTALKDLAEAVSFKFVDLKSSGPGLLNAVRDTVKAANVKDARGELRTLRSKLDRSLAQREADQAKFKAELKDRWKPEEMLSFWVPLLQDRSQTGLAAQAQRDVERVLASRSATDLQKGQAYLVRGLALRNQEKYSQARAALKQARTALADAGGPWLAQANTALREVSNPTGYYVTTAAELHNRGRSAAALAVLERGLKSLPGKQGALLAQRSLIALEAARAKGRLVAGDPMVVRARKDASAAVREGVAEGHYAAGRISEELGQWDRAIESYRAALKIHPARDDAGSRYRAALARCLLRSGAVATRGSRVNFQLAGESRMASPLELMVLLVTLNLQPGAFPPLATPAQREADRLADEILALGDRAPFDVRAQALAIKGLHTRALTVYATGLREKGLLAPGYANALVDLINSHPGLRRPDSRRLADPLEGERHYAAGLNFFFARRYANAEKEFLSAIENDNADARYYYFLGLARLAQGNRDAYEDFDQGAALERLGRPDRATVSAALERVQGPMRRIVNSVRVRPVKDRAR